MIEPNRKTSAPGRTAAEAQGPGGRWVPKGDMDPPEARTRPRMCWVYRCRRPADTPQTEGKAKDDAWRHFVSLKADPRYASLRWGGVIEDESDLWVALSERPGGKRLNEVLRPGDHVIFTRIERGRGNLRDFVRLLRLWDSGGVTVHLLDVALSLGNQEHRWAFDTAMQITMGRRGPRPGRAKGRPGLSSGTPRSRGTEGGAGTTCRAGDSGE